MKEKSKYCNCLCHASNALARNMTRLMDEELSSINLTSSYAYLLMEVHSHDGINPKSISKSLELTPSTVTRLIEKMENRGLLSRTQVGRGTEVRLTSDGHEIMQKIGECIEKFNTRYTSLIGEKNVESLTSNVYEASLRLR